jgi:hypothetical protein
MSMVKWHEAIHEVTGSMALRWCRASAGELVDWAQQLRAVATAMETAAPSWTPVERAAEAIKPADSIPDWLLEDVE